MTSSRAAFIVVDLGFGDAGKGLLTDYLVRAHGARLVVRFNGGAQAGHNVITADGRHHTFSQFGSGSLVPGVSTHLARDVVVHPTALRVEAEHLQSLGESAVFSRISIAPECRVTTPFQQAAGRVRELLRGDARHGSCGVGVGETVQDSLNTPELTLHFGELLQPQRVRDKLLAQRALKQAELSESLNGNLSAELQRELRAFSDPELADHWLQAAASVASKVRCVSDEVVSAAAGPLVLEGAQGVLLDERFGFHPYTTYSQTTFDGATSLLETWGFSGQVQRIGVLRSYAVRHGAGPLPTEDPSLTAATPERHNATGPWQQHVRKGWPDLVLLSYALRACGGLDALGVTHLDALPALPEYRYCFEYGNLGELALPNGIAEQEQLTRQLNAAAPRYRRLESAPQPARPEALLELIQGHTGVPVHWASFGPTAGDVLPLTPAMQVGDDLRAV